MSPAGTLALPYPAPPGPSTLDSINGPRRPVFDPIRVGARLIIPPGREAVAVRKDASRVDSKLSSGCALQGGKAIMATRITRNQVAPCLWVAF